MQTGLICSALLSTAVWFSLPLWKADKRGDSVKKLRVGCPTYWGSLIPALQHTAYADALLSNQYETIVKEQQGGAIGPGLAKSWEANDDFTSFKFRIDTSRRFSNGQKLKAELVKRAWEYGLSLPAQSANSSLQDVLYLVKGFADFSKTKSLSGLRVIDDETLAIDLNKPFRTALSEFSTARMAVFAKDAQGYHGTGPYIISETSDSHLNLRANPYFEDPIGFPEAEVVVIPPERLESALKSGEIDVYAFADRAALSSCSMENQSISCFAGMESGHSIVVPNGLPGRLFSNENYRRALQYLIHNKLHLELLPANYQNNFSIDPQSYLRLQPGRLAADEVSQIIEEGSRYVTDLVAASKKNPIYIVTSEMNNWLLDLLVREGVQVSSSSGIIPTKDRVRMYYKSFEPDLLVSGASVSSGDPDGLFHLLARDGAIFSPIIYRPRVSELLESGRRILDVSALEEHYQKVSRAVLMDVPIVHVGFARGMFAYNPKKVRVKEKLRNREGNQLTLFFPR